MRLKLAAALGLLAILAGCQSPQERAGERLAGWFSDCGYPLGSDVLLSPSEERMLKTCVMALESAYQADRDRRAQSGLAMMQLGTSMMMAPSAPPTARTAAPSFRCTTMSPSAGIVTTRCN